MKTFAVAATLLALAAATVSAETHRYVPQVLHDTIAGSHAPALRIKSGDRVVTSTGDMTALTGPFFIDGAEPGDLLVVSIDKITPNRDVGYSTSTMVANAIDPKSITSRPDPTRFAWSIDPARGTLRMDLSVFRGVDWKTRFANPYYELPLTPTLGSLGVVPAGSDVAGALSAGSYGGNMASAAIAPQTKVMLEVKQPGALLFLGHGLASRGEGSVTGAGIETSMDVEFTVEVVKKKEWPHSSDVRPSTVVGEFPQGWPRLESPTYLTTVGTAPNLLEALQHATIELHRWLDDDFGLNEKGVSVLVGQAIEYEIARIGESSFTVAAKIKKSYLPQPR